MNEFLIKIAILGCYVGGNFAAAAVGLMFGFSGVYNVCLKAGTSLIAFMVIYCFLEGLIWLACKAFDLNIKENDTDKFCATKCKWYELCEKDYENKELLK